MATPHVSAAVAMLILRHPDYTPAQIKALLKSMTVDLNTAGWDGATGSGRIDFRMLDDSLCPKISPIAATAFTCLLYTSKISYNGADGWICLKYTNKIADRVYTCLLYTSQKGHRADVQGQLELAEKQSQRL